MTSWVASAVLPFTERQVRRFACDVGTASQRRSVVLIDVLHPDHGGVRDAVAASRRSAAVGGVGDDYRTAASVQLGSVIPDPDLLDEPEGSRQPRHRVLDIGVDHDRHDGMRWGGTIARCHARRILAVFRTERNGPQATPQWPALRALPRTFLKPGITSSDAPASAFAPRVRRIRTLP
jgi:hypothetical protein